MLKLCYFLDEGMKQRWNDIVGRVEERLAPDDRRYSFGAFLYKEGGSGQLNVEKVDIQDEKVDIQGEKVDIQRLLSQKQKDFSIRTTVHVHRLFDQLSSGRCN